MTGRALPPSRVAPREHPGAPAEQQKSADRHGWACQYPERNPHGLSAAHATGCHYCRIVRIAQCVNDSFPDRGVQAFGKIAEHLGVEPGAWVSGFAATRAACEIAGDDALLAILDHLESIHDKEADDHGEDDNEERDAATHSRRP